MTRKKINAVKTWCKQVIMSKLSFIIMETNKTVNKIIDTDLQIFKQSYVKTYKLHNFLHTWFTSIWKNNKLINVEAYPQYLSSSQKFVFPNRGEEN